MSNSNNSSPRRGGDSYYLPPRNSSGSGRSSQSGYVGQRSSTPPPRSRSGYSDVDHYNRYHSPSPRSGYNQPSRSRTAAQRKAIAQRKRRNKAILITFISLVSLVIILGNVAILYVGSIFDKIDFATEEEMTIAEDISSIELSDVDEGEENIDAKPLTPEELEALRTIMLLRQKLDVPFLFLVGGSRYRIVRHVGPSMGCCMWLTVAQHDELSTKFQPTVRAIRAIADHFDDQPDRLCE